VVFLQGERNKYCNLTFIEKIFSELGSVVFTSQLEKVFQVKIFDYYFIFYYFFIVKCRVFTKKKELVIILKRRISYNFFNMEEKNLASS